MSFGGGGSQGTIRYALIVDDAQATQKLNTFKTNLNSVGTSTNTLNKNMGALGNNFKNATGGLTQQNTLLGQTIKQHTTLGNTIKTNMGRFAGLATGLSATASSALQLAAGFRDYNDAQIAVDRVTRRLSLGQEALGKAQKKLNDLQKSGSASSADLAQAQLDVTQAQKQVEIQTQLVGEAQERMFDSQTQFVASIVPTVLGAVGSLGFAFKDFGGTLGKLPGAFKEGGAAAKLFSSDLGLIGIAATASVAVALLVIDTVQKARDKWKQLGVEFTESSIFDTKKMATSQAEWDEIVKRTSASTLDWAFNQEQVLKKFKEMGGVLDKTGKIMVTVQDRSFGIADAFKKNGETTATWIGWMRIYREQGESNAEIMARLTKAGFDNATATKIAAAANEDYNNKVKAGIPIITRSVEEVKKATDAFIQQDEILGKMTEIKLRQYMLGWENAMAEVIVTTKDNTRQAMTTSGAEIAEGMRTGIAALDVVLQKEAGNATNAAINEMLGIIATRGPEWSKAIADHWTVWTPEVEQAFDEVMKTANTSANKIADDQKKAADAALKAWQDFATQFNVATNITAALGIKFDSAKFTKQLINSLPNSLEKKIKLDLKWEEKGRVFRQSVQDYLQGILEAEPEGGWKWDPDLEIDKKKATTIAKELIEDIDKEFKGGKTAPPELKNLKEKLSKALEDGASEAEIMEILGGAVEDAPPIPVYIVEDPKNVSDTKKNIEEQMAKEAIEIPATPKFSTTAEKRAAWLSAIPIEVPATPALQKPAQTIDWKGIAKAVGYTGPLKGEQGIPIPVFFTPGQSFGAAAGGAASGGIQALLKQFGLKFPVEGGPIIQNPWRGAGKTGGNVTGGANWLAGQGMGGGGTNPMVEAQKLQKALANLANQGANSMRILGKAAATNFNTVANFARGATPDVFKLQKALANLANQGSNSTRILGKAATTNFNTVANYASGATPSLTKLQKSLANLANQGSNSMRILAKAAKTNFNTVANYANGATTAVDKLQSAIDGLQSKTVTVTVKRKLTGPNLGQVIRGGGTIDSFTSFRKGGLISAAKGFVTNGPELMLVGDNPGGNETIAVVPHDNPSDTMAMLEKRFGRGGGGAGFSGNIVINLTNVLADKEITRTFRRELGKEMYRFGPT